VATKFSDGLARRSNVFSDNTDTISTWPGLGNTTDIGYVWYRLMEGYEHCTSLWNVSMCWRLAYPPVSVVSLDIVE
jgi:hypothetical protein